VLSWLCTVLAATAPLISPWRSAQGVWVPQFAIRSRPPNEGSLVTTQHTRESPQQHLVLRLRPHRYPQTPLTPALATSVPHHNTALARALLLRQRPVHPDRPRLVWHPRLRVEDRNQQEIRVVPTDALADTQVRELLERRFQLLTGRVQRSNFIAHALDRSRFERRQRKVRGRRRNIVRRFRVGQHLNQRGLRQGNAEPSAQSVHPTVVKYWCAPDGSQPETFAQRLHHAQIRIVFDQRHGRRVLASEIDVRLIDDDDPLEGLIVQQGTHGVEGYRSPSRVSGRAQKDEFDGWVRRHGFLDLSSSSTP
jgi:hypothetical protein